LRGTCHGPGAYWKGQHDVTNFVGPRGDAQLYGRRSKVLPVRQSGANMKGESRYARPYGCLAVTSIPRCRDREVSELTSSLLCSSGLPRPCGSFSIYMLRAFRSLYALSRNWNHDADQPVACGTFFCAVLNTALPDFFVVIFLPENLS
jgi:hypothetical protein